MVLFHAVFGHRVFAHGVLAHGVFAHGVLQGKDAGFGGVRRWRYSGARENECGCGGDTPAAQRAAESRAARCCRYLSMLGVQVSLAMIAKQWKQRNLRAATAAQRLSAKRPLADRAAPRPNS